MKDLTLKKKAWDLSTVNSKGREMKNHYDSYYIMNRLKDIANHEGTTLGPIEAKFFRLRAKDPNAENLYKKMVTLYEATRGGIATDSYDDAWDEYCKACDRIILKLEIELDRER